MKNQRTSRAHRPFCRWRALILIGGVTLFAASTANAATPIDEFRSASEFYIDNGVARYDGKSSNIQYLLFNKTAGSLNLSVAATDLGVDHPSSVALTGSIHGNEIWFDFDQSFQNAGNIRRIEGRLVVRVMRVAGHENLYCRGGVCPHGLRVVNDPEPTWVRVHGTKGIIQWSRMMDLRFEGFAGNGRPVVDALTFSAPSAVCTRSGGRSYTGRVRLANAMVTDTYVDISASDSAVLPRTHVRVPAGQRSATFPITVAAGYAGTVGVTAASHGVILQKTLRIPTQQVFCFPGGVSFEVVDIEAELMCRGCISTGHIGLEGRVTAQVTGMTHLRDQQGQWRRLADQVGFEGNPIVSSESGDLAGTVLNGPHAGQAFFLRGGDPVPEPMFQPFFVPRGVNHAGVVFGTATGPNGTHAAVWRGQTVEPLALGEGSTIVDGRAFGRGIGERLQGGQRIPVVFSGGQSSDIIVPGNGTVVAVNAIGDVVGNSVQPSQAAAFLLPYSSQTPIFIASPQPTLRTSAVGLSDAGVAVVNLLGQDGLANGAALYQQNGQFTALTDALGPLSTWVHVDEVIDVSANLDLLVRGTLHGQPTTFALRAIVGGPS